MRGVDERCDERFGVLLRRYRMVAGLTQEELAERARLSFVSVGALERGDRRTPRFSTVKLLADALGLAPEERARLLAAARPEGPLAAAPPATGPPRTNVPSPSLDALPNNLPQILTSFIGRETEIAEITALIESHRLVTIVGSGGVGKTRTSLQVAANLLDGSGDGVWFIDLVPLASGDHIPSTVARALRITLPADGDPLEHLARALASTHTLLIFDNCEHLIESTARVIAALLQGCPKVTVLASSRQALGLAGEVVFRLPSLAVPPNQTDGEPLTGEAAARYAAIVLFVSRARAVDDRFNLTDENATIVGEICRRLDGIPLAIELAASRVRLFRPRQLRDRLDERFRILTGGSRDALSRQQTLRALIDWSHDLLDERERTLFRRLGIFVNGFTLEAAAAVGSGDDLDEYDVFDALASLLEKSLVLAEPHGDTLRYRFLESTRLYALEKLAAAGERELTAGRHLRYLRDRFAELRAQAERTVRDAELRAASAAELEDVRAALDGALARSDVLAGAELFASLGGMIWRSLGLDSEGIARNETFLAALPEGETLLNARLSITLSHMLAVGGRIVSAFEVAVQAVALAQASGHGPTLAAALDAFSWCATCLGKFEDSETALAQAETIPDASAWHRLRLLHSRAALSLLRGDLDTAARIREQLSTEFRSFGNTRGEYHQTLNLAEIEHQRGHTQLAIELVREVLPVWRADPDKSLLQTSLANLAGYLVAADDLAGAAAVAREAIAAHATRQIWVAIAMEHLALVCALRGDLTRAAVLEGYVETAVRRQGYQREFTEQTTQDRLTALLRERLGPDDLARLSAQGAGLTPQSATALALEDP